MSSEEADAEAPVVSEDVASVRSSLYGTNTPQHTDIGLRGFAHLHVGAYFASINGCVAHGGWRILFCRC